MKKCRLGRGDVRRPAGLMIIHQAKFGRFPSTFPDSDPGHDVTKSALLIITGPKVPVSASDQDHALVDSDCVGSM
jgi:hypothetical protein